jgi:hypothetical protein
LSVNARWLEGDIDDSLVDELIKDIERGLRSIAEVKEIKPNQINKKDLLYSSGRSLRILLLFSIMSREIGWPNQLQGGWISEDSELLFVKRCQGLPAA